LSDSAIELHHPSDVAALLDELIEQGAALHLSPPGGGELTLQPLQHQRGQALLLRLPTLQSPPSWLFSGEVHAHATLSRVRIDFDIGERRLDRVEGLPVLRLLPPARVRRHQRRQAFRVPPMSALLPRVHLHWEGKLLSMATADLSAGGIALRWPGSIGVPPSGAELDKVVLEISREQRLSLSLRIGHLRPGTGTETVVGCAFLRMPPQGERVMQQFLNDLQRQQRSLG
jgi:c-di-GMP-binding flagellar brake protein YcgR